MQLWFCRKNSSLVDKEIIKWSVPVAWVFCLKSALSRRKGRSGAACQIIHCWQEDGNQCFANLKCAERRYLLSWNKKLTANDCDFFLRVFVQSQSQSRSEPESSHTCDEFSRFSSSWSVCEPGLVVYKFYSQTLSNYVILLVRCVR